MKKREIKSNSKCLKDGCYKRNELEVYGLTKEDIEIIMQYQKQFPELLQDVEGFVVDARQLWEQLGRPQGNDDNGFSKFIKRKVLEKGFVEDVDYVLTKTKTGIRKNVVQKEYTLTVDTAKNVCMMENTEAGRLIRRYFIITERAFRNRIEWNFDRDDTIIHCKQLQRAMMKYHGKLLSNKPEWARSVQQAEFALFNNVVLGMSATEYRKLNGMSKSGNIRNTFTETQLEYVAELERYDADLLMVQNMFDYEERKDLVTKKFILMCE